MASGETVGAQAFDTRDGFVAAVHQAMALAAARQARRMIWVDADFADWPIDDAGLVQALGDWLRLPQRRLQLLAVDPEALRRRCPRFMSLYRLWSHAIEVFAPAADDVPGWPCLLLVEEAPCWCGCRTRSAGAARAPPMRWPCTPAARGSTLCGNAPRPHCPSRPWGSKGIPLVGLQCALACVRLPMVRGRRHLPIEQLLPRNSS